MLLTNLFQLINNLDKHFYIFYKPNKEEISFPIKKISLESTRCILICGKSSNKQLSDLVNLLGNMKQKNIPLNIQVEQKNFPVYGLQIDRLNNRIYLK